MADMIVVIVADDRTAASNEAGQLGSEYTIVYGPSEAGLGNVDLEPIGGENQSINGKWVVVCEMA